MSELFADGYPTRLERRCGMHGWLDIARAVMFLAVAIILVIVVFRLFGSDDPPG